MSRFGLKCSHAIAMVVALSLAGPASAQIGTATVKGKVTAGAAAAPAGTSVVAVNKGSGFTYRAVTKTDGSYVLTNLPPGDYELTVGGPDESSKAEVTLTVGEVAAFDITLAAKGDEKVKTEEIVVTGASRQKLARNSEIGTTVSRKMIDVIPQSTHNFMSSADLAPGVVFEQDSQGNTRLRSGSQNQDNVNVFVDGVSQKNNILRSGITGQDTSRGNPFPQTAIAQFKVITQNYKAEYDQVSSAAITAVTKSGTNDLHGDVYVNRSEIEWAARSKFQTDRERDGQMLPFSSKNEYGISLGGPVVKDLIHFFIAYDGKSIDDSRQVVPKNIDKFTTGGGIVPELKSKGGSFVDPFSEHLVFAKLTGQLADDKKLSASVKLRLESDRRPENNDLSAHGNDKDRTNDDVRVDLLHEWSLGSSWLSESRAGYQWAKWNPETVATTPLIKYRVSQTNANVNDAQDIIWVGGSPDAQDRRQSGFTLAQDMTYTGLRSNVFKGGAKVNFMKYELSGTHRRVDEITTLVNSATGLPYWDGSACTGDAPTPEGNTNQCRVERALPEAAVNMNNAQIGLYLQDDWTIGRFEINAGVRWDYETNMLNNDYTTPADRVAALHDEDGRTFGNCATDPNCIVAPVGQTYAESLAKGGVNIDDYISTGSSRKAFKGAFAPRLGVSFDVLGDRSTVVFGGYGRSYDRTMANHVMDETQNNQVAGRGEIWLIRNDFDMPYTDQLSAGVRRTQWGVSLEAAVSMVNAKNQFQWFSGNRDPNGGWFTQPWFDPLWGGPRGYGNLILGDFIGENRTRSLMVKAEKPYTKSSGWSASVAYTLSDAETKNNDWNDGNFDWTYGKTTRHWNPSLLVDRHRLVAAAMADDLLPWGTTVSAKWTFGSGLSRRLYGVLLCDQDIGPCKDLREATSANFNQVDLGLAKSFKSGPGAFTLRADVLNVFNSWNYNRGDGWGGFRAAPGAPANQIGGNNLDVDKPTSMRGPMRTLFLTGSYAF